MLKLETKIQPSVYRTVNTTMTTTSPLQYKHIIIFTVQVNSAKHSVEILTHHC